MIPLLVKFATRQRPDRFRTALELLVHNTWRPKDLHFLFTLDEDDSDAQRNIDVINAILPVDGRTIVIGRSESKIDAVNRDILSYSGQWKTVIVASDDMHATPNWDHWVIEAMREFYPDGDGCLWFGDGFQKDICTIPCMGRAEYDRLGYIYNPLYKSVFADDEQTHAAFALGKMTKIDHVLFKHDHPAWNNALKPDALYQRNEAPAVWAHDEAIYRQRKAAGFP